MNYYLIKAVFYFLKKEGEVGVLEEEVLILTAICCLVMPTALLCFDFAPMLPA
jgi:hypothetical protein